MAVEILITNEGKLDCHTCDDKLKEERGHYKDGIVTFWIEGKPIKRCPLTIITPLSWEYIKAFGLYEDGFLPSGLGWNDESYKYNQAMAILKNEFNKWQNKEIKKQKNR